MSISEQDLIDAYASGRSDEAEENAAPIARLQRDRSELMLVLAYVIASPTEMARTVASQILKRAQQPLGDEA